MGKGGPLAFLNKKGWHPGNLRNMEEVWKREQAAAKEEKKIKEMQKKLEEEREKEEIQQLAERAGHVMQSQRLDWMYQGGVAAKEDAERRQEEHLLGKAPDLDARNEPEAKSQMERVTEGAGDETGGGTGRGPLELSSTEQWSRMNDDPLFMIKKREQSSLRSIRENPVTMRRIRDEIQKVRGKKDRKDKEKKERRKRDKKEKKAKSKAQGEGAERRRPSVQDHDGDHRDRDSERPRSRSKQSRANRDGDRDRAGSGQTAEASGRVEERGGSRREASREKDDGGAAGGRHHDGASALSADGQYGLTFGGNAHLVKARTYEASAVASGTRERLADAAKRKAEEEAAAANAKQQRCSEYRTGRLSEEERRRKLAEMMDNAEQHEAQRSQRLQRAADADAAEADADAASRGAERRQGLVGKLSRDLYAGGGAAAIGDRIKSRRHYSQRGPSSIH